MVRTDEIREDFEAGSLAGVGTAEHDAIAYLLDRVAALEAVVVAARWSVDHGWTFGAGQRKTEAALARPRRRDRWGGVMSKKTASLTWHGPFQQFTCRCGQKQTANPIMPWCCKCAVEYDIQRHRVVFRPDRHTPRFAWAKAVGLAGGARIGGSKEE